MNPIEAHAFTKRFGQLTAVNNLDLQIAQGEFFGFLGHNGAGKTTTLQILSGQAWHSYRPWYRCRHRPYRSQGRSGYSART